MVRAGLDRWPDGWSLRILAMSKSLLIAVFALAVAALGCGGGSNNTTDGGAGATGTAGSTGGSGGGAAGAGGGAAGLGGGAAGGDAEVPGLANGVMAPACTTDLLSPSDFCAILIAFCGTATPHYTTQAECVTTYAAVGTSDPFAQKCESEHLCNAAWDTGADRTLHCSHAVGKGGVCVFSN
jgi:hypothetical protein